MIPLVYDSPDLILPYPDKQVSPNARLHWSEKAEAVAAARKAGYYLARDAELRVPDVNLQLWIKAIPPDKRGRDDDNIVSSLKPYRDGIFDYLQINDKRIRLTSFGFGKPEGRGAVWLWIRPLKTLPHWLQEE